MDIVSLAGCREVGALVVSVKFDGGSFVFLGSLGRWTTYVGNILESSGLW